MLLTVKIKPLNSWFKANLEVNFILAERAGFEPAVKFPLHPLSRRAP